MLQSIKITRYGLEVEVWRDSIGDSWVTYCGDRSDADEYDVVFKNGDYTIDSIKCLIYDENNVLWLGGDGLASLHNGLYTEYVEYLDEHNTIHHLLPHIQDVEIDTDGSIWASSSSSYSKGIYHFYNIPLMTSVEDKTDENTDMITITVAPNPANPNTTISYSLPDRMSVSLAVYNITGQKVATLVDNVMTAGMHTASFDGAHLASGVYFYHFKAGDVVKTGKIMMVK